MFLDHSQKVTDAGLGRQQGLFKIDYIVHVESLYRQTNPLSQIMY